jgi:hypothetical protein
MRRRNRELNIFSMSALDLFASAMGAFILITLILMPYYLTQKPEVPAQKPEVPAQKICPELTEPQQCEEIPTPPPVICPTIPAPRVCDVCPVPLPPVQCEQPRVVRVPMIMDKMLLIEMTWSRKVDIDLHVITPDGEFYYGNKTIDGAPGALITDRMKGGSSSKLARELWLNMNPTPGEYKVCFNYYAINSVSGPTKVKGRLLKPSGPILIPELILSNVGEKVCPFKFKMGDNFQVEVL